MHDIIDFWSGVPGSFQIHPRDGKVLARAKNQFRLESGPNPYFGPLRSAKVFVLYLSPGFRDDYDLSFFQLESGQSYLFSQREGNACLPSSADHERTYTWWSARVRQFGVDPDSVRDGVAFLNIGAYRSKSFNDWPLLAALPSSRAMLDWAQSSLFRRAELGECVVVCLRSARHWGLSVQEVPFGEALFAPPVGMSGFMHNGPARALVGAAVRRALSK